MRNILRSSITTEDYKEILQKESHHDHEIISDEHNVLRWKENATTVEILKNISLNDLCPLLITLGYGKNSEVYRKLYRDMGYSLSGYYDIFYWEANNEAADAYRYKPTSLVEKVKEWWVRKFCIITKAEAEARGLDFQGNIHDEDISYLRYRSIWTDVDGGRYRVSECG